MTVLICLSCHFFVQVIRRLRERGEPIRLFGESDYDAFQRLRKIEILTPEVNKVGLSNSQYEAQHPVNVTVKVWGEYFED